MVVLPWLHAIRRGEKESDPDSVHPPLLARAFPSGGRPSVRPSICFVDTFFTASQ